MGASVNLRHVVVNRNKSEGIESLKRLLNHTIAQKELQSNILYRQTKDHLIVEYFSKSIPSLIYNNEIFENKAIVTIYSSDLGDKDSWIIFDSEWNGEFNYEPCHYAFNNIEVTGSPDEIKVFKEYLYLKENNLDDSISWCIKTHGKLVLQTINDRLCFSGKFPNYRLVEDKKVFESMVQNENCWISSIECEDILLNERLEKILTEMFHHPEYYGKNIDTVKFSNQGQAIFTARFNKIDDEWLFFHHYNLWKIVSNKRLRLNLGQIAYH